MIINVLQLLSKSKHQLSLCLRLSLIFLGMLHASATYAAQQAETIPVPASPPAVIAPVPAIPNINQAQGAVIEHSNVIEAPSAGNEAVPPVPEKTKRIPSLFFTYWQHQSILDALQSRGGDSGLFNEEFLPEDSQQDSAEKLKKPQNREVALGGIVYVHPKEWTVWLNGMRLTPDATPVEVIDIKVYKDHIDLKWHDIYTNKIFPIRIRPHQRFNLDTRVFLPG